jgi:serine/threonine protein kinase
MTGSQIAEAGPNPGGPAVIDAPVPPLLNLLETYADNRYQVTDEISVRPDRPDREVYRATDWRDMGVGQVALKVYKEPDLATRLRVDREIAAHQAVESQSGILALRGSGVLETDDGSYRYIATPYRPRGTLLDRIEEQPHDLDVALSMAAQILPGLVAVHRRGMVHLDVKPGNIVAGSQEGEWDLTDFGIVESFDDSGPELPVINTAEESTGVLGTVGYIAPEIMAGGHPGPEADIFGLAVTVYRVVTGEMPYASTIYKVAPGGIRYAAPDINRYLDAVTNEAPVPISALNNSVPADLDKLIMAGLRRDPGDRPSADRFAEVVMANAA